MLEPETLPVKAKLISHHPFEKNIRHKYSDKINNIHNSVHNPPYNPREIIRKQTRKPSKKKTVDERITVTIVGNRLDKYFIRCVHIAEGLHKYRADVFDAPQIRALSPVQWPDVWKELKHEFGGTIYCLQSDVAVLVNGNCLGGFQEFDEFVGQKYRYYLSLDFYKLCVESFANFIKQTKRSFAYMHISIDEKHVGSLIFMLYSDVVPLTCENFLRLCSSRRGGYSGTPIHRVVTDGWVQGGGFGLKEVDMQCENFIVPHDQRGVIGMANHGRDIECSTQFYVLLQPAQWMNRKFVAFGQLVEGVNTLAAIEKVPTWYESPASKIIIQEAGILNMECHHIPINKNTMEYLSKHVEDLNELADWLWDLIITRTFLEIEMKEINALAKALKLDAEDAELEETAQTGLHSTKRFLQKKEDIDIELSKAKADAAAVKRSPKTLINTDEVNNDFDVEEVPDNYWEFEEEDRYQHMSIPATPSLVVKPIRPYYLAFTDVPYPGEKDSTYDLKKFLKGDYCLESDLYADNERQMPPPPTMKVPESPPPIEDEVESVTESVTSMDSEEEKEIRRYLKLHSDRVSFAGGVIRKIARTIGKINIFQSMTGSQMIGEDGWRRFSSYDKLQQQNVPQDSKKVLISLPKEVKEIRKIKRRQTGFVRPLDLDKIHFIESSNPILTETASRSSDHLSARKVRIASSTQKHSSDRARAVSRRPTGYPPHYGQYSESDLDVKRQSVLSRLYDDVAQSADEFGPTLKDYKPISECHEKKILLTVSSNSRMTHDTGTKYFKRESMISNISTESFEQMLNYQHGKKFVRKISSDYVHTIDQVQHRGENSLRTIEYAKTRPALTVKEYQKKYSKEQDDDNTI